MNNPLTIRVFLDVLGLMIGAALIGTMAYLLMFAIEQPWLPYWRTLLAMFAFLVILRLGSHVVKEVIDVAARRR